MSQDVLELAESEEGEAQAAETAAKAEARREVDDIKWLMGHEQGRRIAWRLLDKAGVYRTSFTGNSATFFNEGRRDIGLFLLGEVQSHCPDRFMMMLKEHNK